MGEPYSAYFVFIMLDRNLRICELGNQYMEEVDTVDGKVIAKRT